MDALEFLSQDRGARRLYEERQKFLHDEASMIKGALEKGLKEGLKKENFEKKVVLSHDENKATLFLLNYDIKLI